MGQDDAPAPGTLVGRYVVDAPIGSGAMGVVVRAYDPDLDRTVALKLWRASDPGDSTSASTRLAAANARLVREAQAMARLSHPNVVRVHDVGVVDDRVFLALDLIDGGTLRTWLATGPRGPRTRAAILEVLGGAGKGLAAAHEIGLVHRDFKPDNVLVDASGRAYVTDFGLVRVGPPTRGDGQVGSVTGHERSGEVTGAGTILGTPAYMAPEQLEGADVDERSDQFAFCVTLYEALYGARPFAGATVDRLASAVLRGELAPVPIGRKVPAAVRRVLLRGLSRHPGDRFASMRELLAALRRATRVAKLRVWVPAVASVAIIAIAVGSWTQQAPCIAAAEAHQVARASSRHALDAMLATHRVEPMVAEHARHTAAIWLTAWSGTHDEMCRVTLERGERSETALASTRSCLGAAHAELDAIIVAASTTPEVTGTDLARALAELPEPAACRDVVSTDESYESRDALAEVARLRARRALHLDPLAPTDTDPDPLVAFEWALTRAAIDPSTAARELDNALIAAERLGSATARARGWIARVVHLAHHGGALADVARSASLAHAAIARAGDGSDWHADVDLAHGEALLAAQRTEEALDHLRRAAELRASPEDADPLAQAEAALAIARAHRVRNEPNRALAEQLRAVALVEATFGADHPEAATIRIALADTLTAMGDVKAAAGQRARGLAVLGAGHR